MKSLLDHIHARVGDLWWYSAMIFLACRSGDAIQAFIGLWLVPKYVGPQELGAVLPLQQLSTLFTVPLAVVAVVFSKYVNTYATRGEYGKVKCFIRDVFTCSFVLFIICVAGAYFIVPFFYERLRIASGSLTFLILLCGLVGNLSSIISSAQQGLKRFKMMAAMNFLGAPIRLVTLLIAMPFRALSGYILGQTTPTATTSLLSILDIHKTLKPYTPDTSWRKDLPDIWRYLWPVAIFTIIGATTAAMLSTVMRQRLTEVESSAYYLLSRFAEISSYATVSMSVVLFPLASEAHESGRSSNSLLAKTITLSVLSTIALILVFTISAPTLLSLTRTWQAYLPFSEVLPWVTASIGSGVLLGVFLTHATACRHLKSIGLIYVLSLMATALLVSFTGYEFFYGILPDALVEWIADLHLARLSRLMKVLTVWNLAQILIFLICDTYLYRRSRIPR